MAIAPPKHMTWEEYLEWANEDVRAEWVDGEVIYMSPASTKDLRAGRFFVRLFSEYLDEHPVGEVFYEGLLMRNPKRPSGRLPDITFISNSNAYRLTPTNLDGPADIAIEIISPDSRARDTVDKFREYEELGVREYWWVDEENYEIRFFRLDENDRYQEAFPDDHGAYHSAALPGFWFKVRWIWPLSQPTMRQVRKEWGIE
jgi:Uma2 family endonuclease